MKTKLLLIIAFITLNLQAQTATPFVTGLLYQTGLEIKDNTLYFLQQGVTDAENIIYTVDITATTPTATIFMDNISLFNPYGMLLEGNMLYYTDLGGRIYRTDITDPTHSITIIATGLQRCRGLVIRNDYLYISTFDTGKIVKLNLNDTFPTTTTDVFTGLSGPASIEFNGDELYISGAYNGDGGIHKINVTDNTPTITPVILVTNAALDKIRFIGNEMYYTQTNGEYKLSKIDITDAFPPTKTDVVVDIINFPTGFVFDGDDIYITSYYSGISKFTQSTASVQDTNLNSVTIYPNPTSNIVIVSGLENIQSYKIYNILGKEIKTTTILENNTLDVSRLENGVYLIKIKGENQTYSKKFIKQ